MAREGLSTATSYSNTSGSYDADRNAAELGIGGLPVYNDMGLGGTTIGSSTPVIGGSSISLAPVIQRANETIKNLSPLLTILLGVATLIVLIVYRK
jgi:hypothetical protein